MKENEFIVVVGTSAGGMKALTALIEQLPKDFPAPLLIVQHLSSDATGDALLNELNKIGKLKCIHATQGEKIKSGQIYLAPSDNHLMIEENGSILITKGAQENRSRPAIDPLFRSAATSFGNRTIGILLTGYLDDGTSGLIAIQRCGGICIIQDPADADYPDMPKNALNQIKPDYCIPIAEMGGILSTLVARKSKKQVAIPEDITKEVQIAKRVLSDLPSVNSLGEQVPFNCPGCGGVLWKMNKGPDLRYRCHTGHAYTAATLLTEQTMKIEETMWTALRMFEERKNLLTTIAQDQKGATATSAKERSKMSQIHIDRIRAILLSNDEASVTDSAV
ncbi:chemotaxis protein CheB [Flavobacterium circumlabens]|uniref:protein-glutamate methylesterase n=1 Tax=Flavobacterium circumlabens TaxID=2133765 RepID=A0A4Y7UC21_9FLAO|nr:chemotaxis protein CheB [Flavobacterium circumlabens]TCN56552.1 two-component system chemotaxis response regulator CheB [Flavobacterium circumlabens]TEB43568.1 chemotaxis protein CheB [Flavobacterium circumlabens]